MKKMIFFLGAVFFYGGNCNAQNESRFKSLKDNINKNELATQNPKKGIDPKTWMDRGKLFHEAYNVNVGYLRPGMQQLETKLFFKEPKQVITSDDGKETYEYSQLNLHFVDGALATWEETMQNFVNPLGEAVKAYQKAASLDEKGKNAKKITEAYKSINLDLESKFLNEYSLGLNDNNPARYEDAYNTIMQRIEVSKLLGFNDTTYYYYAGWIASAQGETDNSKWQLAVDNLEKAFALGYKETDERKGEIYDLLYNACINTGDSIKALEYAQTGFALNPNYDRLMYNLINYYLFRGENHKTLEYIEQAIAKDPKSPSLLFAKGRVLDQLGEVEKALEAYEVAIQVDPQFFDAYYNKAVTYHNYAVKLMDDANEAKTNAEFEVKQNLAYDEFAKAIPLLEKALELNPEDTTTMDILKTLYFRLRVRNPEYEAKINAINEKLAN